MKVAVFCEARADFEISTALLDRVLAEEGPSWLGELLLETDTSAVREWQDDRSGSCYFNVHRLTLHAAQCGVERLPHGRFTGEPGGAGATMARTAFAICRKLHRDSPIGLVLLVWDMDGKGKARRQGLEQARTEASSWAEFGMVLGCPDPAREAWVLTGFEPKSDAEQKRLDQLKAELSFDPTRHPERLNAKSVADKRNPKRVLSVLTAGDHERESACWREPPLEALRERGANNGLKQYLDELKSDALQRFSSRSSS